MKSRRLDVELVERGLAESREQAQRLILAGEVWVEGQRWDKASKPCAASANIEVRGAERYVSRGGFKMEGALKGFDLAVKGLRCLDLGASTGGFTDCLLQHGAREVVAVDVGHGQLHWRLRRATGTYRQIQATGQMFDPHRTPQNASPPFHELSLQLRRRAVHPTRARSHRRAKSCQLRQGNHPHSVSSEHRRRIRWSLNPSPHSAGR